MDELFGDHSHLQLEGLDNDSADRFFNLFSQFTAQDCFVTEKYTDGTLDGCGGGQVSPAGTMSVETAHNPLQRHPMPLSGGTSKRCCFCFDPPSTWNKAWPVDRDRLYELGSNDADTDKAIWQYDNQYESNHRDPIRADGTVPEDSDAYGLMVLNGEEEAMDANFKESHTVVWRTVSVPRVKRDILTKNQPVLERASEHMEETFQVYCNVPPGAEECETV
ncbi:hypothetical protein GCG54_00011643 [Colletotrichum gloeosporioides]|uniref:Uncharacterized protein n=1 Tax=Colletotrichum gloeosporioides TaxID=474922 RepID=A0A8H4CHE3_COLGL|nr:uncharacterized protein GCG54_00011643 [Colletotrichum gloeosporioides]KAF3803806.1 hypothetical protein GCG54_00011643 [Colletotrichum gloeosporioides]